MSKLRTAVGDSGKYECGTWSTLPLWAALALMDQRPELAKRFVFWEWKPSFPDHVMIHTDNSGWYISKTDRVVW